MKKIHRAWFVLIGCCLIQSAVLGIIFNCRGIFFDPICSELSFSLADLTSFGLYFGVACCVSMPLVPKVFEKENAHVILLFLSIVLGLSLYCCSFFNSLWQWYAIGVLQGLLCAFVYAIAATTVINNWFNEKKGLALGIAGACPALTGAIMNPIASKIIYKYGWRIAYKTLGIIFLLMIVPAYLFLVRINPEKIGQKAYGEKTVAINQGGVGIKETLKSYSFYILFVIAGIAACITCYTQLLPKYGKTLQFISNPSVLASLSMIGNCTCKFFIGDIADKKGVKVACLLSTLFLMIGFLLLNFNNMYAVYCGSFFIGVSTSVTIIVIPLLIRSFFGNKEYAKKMSYISMSSNLFNSLGITIYGFVIDKNGYSFSLIMSLIMSLFILLITLLAIKIRKKEIHEQTC